MGKKPHKNRSKRNARAAHVKQQRSPATHATKEPSTPSFELQPTLAIGQRFSTRPDQPAFAPNPLIRTKPGHTQTAPSSTRARPTTQATDSNPAKQRALREDPDSPPPSPGPGSCSEATADIEPGLAATYWSDGAITRPPGDLHVRFSGIRTDAAGQLGDGDRFERVARVENLTHDSGRLSVTTKVKGINSGAWRIKAVPFDPMLPSKATGDPQTIVTNTRLAALAQGPGVRLWTWPTLISVGVVLALVLQSVLLSRVHANAVAATGVSLLACALGYLGAKAWYLILHRQHPRKFATAGACIQGFLVVALGVLVLGGFVLGMNVGTLLDVTTPGLFLAMGVGRPGCFLGGCCAGRPTTSKWGLWSSNRTVGIRRAPVQLLEAAAALLIGVITLTLVLTVDAVAGAIFVAAAAAYTFVRQLLFPLRADPHTRLGRRLTIAISLAILVVDAGVLTLTT
ncbi:Prolipoprotein diacylglyceryl transferase (plasmid) [Rhodococcus sp. WAY2]|nr:Prolipoprotein diacylglyceryl transferase [Rhodococcus sp. WAY2]